MNHFRLGSTPSLFARQDPLENLTCLKQAGYDCVDLGLFLNTDHPLFSLSSREFDEYCKTEAVRVTDAGLQISQTHGPWRFPPQDFTEEDRAERFEKMSRSLHGTSVMGCPYMVIHPIMPYGAAGGDDVPRFFEINFDFFRRLCRAAEEENVVICLENMPFPALPMTTPGQILDFVKAIDSPWLRICLDTGHSLVCGVQPCEAARITGSKYLKTLHVHDNDGKGDWHHLPGDGIADWPAFAGALRDIGYEGVFSLETGLRSIPEEERSHRAAVLNEFLHTLISG